MCSDAFPAPNNCLVLQLARLSPFGKPVLHSNMEQSHVWDVVSMACSTAMLRFQHGR